MNSDLSNIIFSSLIGGNNDDAAFSLAINPTNYNIYVIGNTTSSSFPGDKSGVINPAFQGGVTDGFISIISPDGSAIIKSSYLGTTGNDIIYGIKFDNAGYPYIMGTTTGSWPVINATFSQAGGKQFVAKLQPGLTAYVYSTIFGANRTTPSLSLNAFHVDCLENVYLSGWGGNVNLSANYPPTSTAGLTITPNALKSATDSSDFYLFVLERNAASQLYGTFFGQNGGLGDHVDGGTSRFDPSGTLYQAICANCGGGAIFPTTTGAWSSNNLSGNCVQAVIKVSFDICAAVPVHLNSFTGKSINNKHELTWTVSNEERGDTYIIEKTESLNIAFMQAYQTTSNKDAAANNYVIQLPAGYAPEVYYRLKIISASSSIRYSQVILLKQTPSKQLQAYISGDNLFINIPTDAVSLNIYTIDGKKVFSQNIQSSNGYTSFPLINIPKGSLIIEVKLQSDILFKKILY